MTTFNIFANRHNEQNGGICREHALCDYMGVDKVHHDNIDYRTASDISAYGMNISVCEVFLNHFTVTLLTRIAKMI